MMKRILSILLLGAALAQAEPVPTALKVGDSIPDVTLRSVDNQELKLRTLVAEKPTVLIFFRGGWCPFCNAQLSSLLGIEQELNKEGVQLIAIGMDQPSKLRETMQHDKLDYLLLSDSDATAVKAFGIAYKVDDVTLARMKSFNVDLNSATGNSDHILPHPSVFVVSTSGIIRFVHADTNFKVRLAASKVLEAAKLATQ
jgi:peroxiredoxin